LRLCCGARADFKALVLEHGEESVDTIGAAFADLGVEEAGVDKALGDALFAGKELLALTATKVSETFFVGVARSGRIYLMCSLRLVKNMYSDESRP
jgi:hypothetical protein